MPYPMKHSPQLGVYKNSTGTNVFDGQQATSYGWYVYAVKLANGEIIVATNFKTRTTIKHVYQFLQLVTGDYTVINAPFGMSPGNIGKSISVLRQLIKDVEIELEQPGIRQVDKRQTKIFDYLRSINVLKRVDNEYVKNERVRRNFLDAAAG